MKILQKQSPGVNVLRAVLAALNPRKLVWPVVVLSASFLGFMLAIGLGGAFGAPPPSAYAEPLLQGYCGDGTCTPNEELSCPADCGGDGIDFFPIIVQTVQPGVLQTVEPDLCANAVCGDGVCTEGCETAGSCTADCGTSCDDIICGDGVCAWNDCEGSWNCEADCQWCGDGICAAAEQGQCPEDCGGSVCGDGVCAEDESFRSCPSDCGPVCGDGVCEGDETFSTCSSDCSPVCGDGLCQGDETFSTCSADCAPVCGDGTCEGGETCGNCSSDCGVCAPTCGDGVCNGDETNASCPADCEPVCGDGVCNGTETFETCSSDCEAPPTPTATEPPVAPELAVAKMADPASVDEPGGQVTFTVQVTNGGEETLTLTSMEDSLQANLAELSENTCTLPQVLPAGSTYECQYSFGVTGSGGESVTNTISVTAEDTAGQTAMGSATASVMIAAVEEAATGCQIVPVDVVNDGAVNAFLSKTKDYQAPLWMICDEPPEQVCIPIDPSFDRNADISQFSLLDCTSEGECTSYTASSINQDELCFHVVAGTTGQPICGEGCSFMIQTGESGLPTQALLLAGIGLALLLLLILLIVLLMVRRRRDVEEEMADFDQDLTTM
jgi:uncharacterized repeat protein (TIGR01451 family)